MDRHARRDGERRDQGAGAGLFAQAELQGRRFRQERAVAVRDRSEAGPGGARSGKGGYGAEEMRKAVMTTVVGDVSAAYFNLLELDTELEIAKDTLATRQESLNLIRTRQQGGVATMLDVRQAEQLVYAAAQTIPEIERLTEQTENRINLLLGKAPGPVARGRSLTEQEQPPAAPAGLPSSLLERRPDIRAAEAALMAATANIGVAKAAYFPQISLTGFL